MQNTEVAKQFSRTRIISWVGYIPVKYEDQIKPPLKWDQAKLLIPLRFWDLSSRKQFPQFYHKLMILKIGVLMNCIGNCKSFLHLILSHLIFREIPLTLQVLTHMINLYILPSNLFFTLEDISISNLLDREFHIWSYVWGFSKWNFSLNLCLVNYACWLWIRAWGLQSSERNLNFNHLHF